MIMQPWLSLTFLLLNGSCKIPTTQYTFHYIKRTKSRQHFPLHVNTVSFPHRTLLVRSPKYPQKSDDFAPKDQLLQINWITLIQILCHYSGAARGKNQMHYRVWIHECCVYSRVEHLFKSLSWKQFRISLRRSCFCFIRNKHWQHATGYCKSILYYSDLQQGRRPGQRISTNWILCL